MTQTFAYDLSSASSKCTQDTSDTASTCTLPFALAPDTYAITVSTYDKAQSANEASATGNELSTDTETVVVGSDAANTFAFYLLAVVEGFHVVPPGNYARVTNPNVFGAPGSASSDALTFEALDPDGNPIDQYAGLYGFAPAIGTTSPPSSSTFTMALTVSGSTCTSGCFTIANSSTSANATSVQIAYPNGGDSATAMTPGVNAGNTQENVTLAYDGTGSEGSGIDTAGATGTPSGNAAAQPTFATASVADVTGNPFDAYTVPTVTIAPIVAYVTDYVGDSSTSVDFQSYAGVYALWAAQAAIPSGKDPKGTSYANSTTCNDITDYGGQYEKFYAGFGYRFLLQSTDTLEQSCSFTVYDATGASATIQVDLPALPPRGGGVR